MSYIMSRLYTLNLCVYVCCMLPQSERIQWDGHQNSIALAQQRQREMAMRAPLLPAKPSAPGAPVAGPALPGPVVTSVVHPPPPSMTAAPMHPPVMPLPMSVPVAPVIPVGLPPSVPFTAPFGLPPPTLMPILPVLPPPAVMLPPAPLAVPTPPAPAAVRHAPTTVVAQGATKKARADNGMHCAVASSFITYFTFYLTVLKLLSVDVLFGKN